VNKYVKCVYGEIKADCNEEAASFVWTIVNEQFKSLLNSFSCQLGELDYNQIAMRNYIVLEYYTSEM